MRETLWEQIGDYKLIREIGKGSFGIVYEATQISLDRKVALKVMPSEFFPTKKFVERFKTEAIAAAQLRHPNIITVHEFGFDEKQSLYYFSMDYAPGDSLAEFIATKKGFTSASTLADSHFTASMNAVMHPSAQQTQNDFHPSCPETASFTPLTKEECILLVSKFIGVTEALHYAHEFGIIHQDIKPSNMVFDNSGRICLLDFGTGEILRLKRKKTTSAIEVGTPLYASPEHFDPDKTRTISNLSDIYSLGVSFYEMLTLRLPFIAEDYEQLEEKVLHTRPPSPHHINSAIPKTLSNIVMKAIARDPNERYQSAGEFAEELKHFLHHEPTKVENPGIGRRIILWHYRNKTLAKTLYISTALLVLTLVFFLSVLASSRQTLFHKAEGFYENEAYDIAVEYFSKVEDTSPYFTEAMLLKADCLNKLEDHRQMLAFCQDLIYRYPERFPSPRLYLFEARAFDDLKLYKEARKAFKYATLKAQGKEEKASTHYEYAKFFDEREEELNDPTLSIQAQEEYERALEFDPTMAKGHFKLGMLFKRRKQFQKAEEHILKATELRPEEKPKYFAGLGDLYLDWTELEDHLDKAVNFYKQAIEKTKELAKEDKTAEYLMKQGQALIRKSEHKAAIKSLEKSLELETTPQALYFLATAQKLAGDSKAAARTAELFFSIENTIYALKTWELLENSKKVEIITSLLRTLPLDDIELEEYPKEFQTFLKTLQN